MLLKTFPVAIAMTFLVGCGGGSSGDSADDRVVDDQTTTGADTEEGVTDGGVDENTTTGGTTDGATTDGTDTGTIGTTDGSVDGGTNAGGTTDGTATGGTGGSADGDTISGDANVPGSALSLDLSPLDVERFTAGNFEAALETAIAFLRGEDLTDRVLELRSLERKLVDGTDRFQELNITVPGYNRVLLCPDGGRIDSNLENVDEPLEGAGHRVDQCAVDGTTYNGLFSFDVERDDRRGVNRETISFGALPVTFAQADGTVTAISSLGVTETAAVDGSGNRASSTHFANVSLETRVDEASFSFSLVLIDSGDSAIPDVRIGTLAPAANARYQVVGPSTIEFPSGTTISLSSASPFLAENGDANFATGQLEVRLRTSERTGNFMTMSADNGDPSTFDVLIFEDSISVQTFTLPWSERYRFGRPNSLLD